MNGDVLGDEPPFSSFGAHPQKPTSIWGNATRPLPTNAWWENAVLTDGDVVGGNVVNTLPYLVQALSDGLHVALPTAEVATSEYVSMPLVPVLAFGADSGLPGSVLPLIDQGSPKPAAS